MHVGPHGFGKKIEIFLTQLGRGKKIATFIMIVNVDKRVLKKNARFVVIWTGEARLRRLSRCVYGLASVIGGWLVSLWSRRIYFNSHPITRVGAGAGRHTPVQQHYRHVNAGKLASLNVLHDLQRVVTICDTLDLFNASINSYHAEGNVAFNSGACQLFTHVRR